MQNLHVVGKGAAVMELREMCCSILAGCSEDKPTWSTVLAELKKAPGVMGQPPSAPPPRPGAGKKSYHQ